MPTGPKIEVSFDITINYGELSDDQLLDLAIAAKCELVRRGSIADDNKVSECPYCHATTGHWHGCGFGLRNGRSY